MDWKYLIGIAILIVTIKGILPHYNEQREERYKNNISNCVQQRHATPELAALDSSEKLFGADESEIIKKVRVQTISEYLSMPDESFYYLSNDEQERLLNLVAEKEILVSREDFEIEKHINENGYFTLEALIFPTHFSGIKIRTELWNKSVSDYKAALIEASEWNQLSYENRKEICEGLSKEELNKKYNRFSNKPEDEYLERQIADGLFFNKEEQAAKLSKEDLSRIINKFRTTDN